MRNGRVTISLPAELLDEAPAAVRHGVAASISAYVAEAVAARHGAAGAAGPARP